MIRYGNLSSVIKIRELVWYKVLSSLRKTSVRTHWGCMALVGAGVQLEDGARHVALERHGGAGRGTSSQI